MAIHRRSPRWALTHPAESLDLIFAPLYSRPDLVRRTRRIYLVFLLFVAGTTVERLAAAQPPPEDAGPRSTDEEPVDEEEPLGEEEPTGEEEATEPYSPETDPDEGIDIPRTVCQGRTIRNIEIEGNRRVEEADVLATMSLRPGVPCTDREVAEDARTLWDLNFFDDIRVEAEPLPDNQIDLTVHLTERPAIARIKYEGNDEVNDEDMDDVITLREGEILSIPKVRDQVTKIRDKYAEEGFFLAEVEYEIKRLGNDNNEVEVVFHIREGDEVTVRRIRFLGNHHIPADDLLGIMQTSQTGFFSFISSSDNFNRQHFDEDVTRLQAWYYDQGYLAMTVGNPRIELTADRQHIDITIPVNEGPRFRVGRMEVTEQNPEGEPIEPLGGRDQTIEDLGLEAGDWFNRSAIAQGLQTVTRRYRDRGYATAQLDPQTELDVERRIVDINVVISRGPIVHIERINIRGNSKTRDRVIRRELLILESDRYSQTQIELSRAAVNRLGYFESVDFAEEEGSAPDLIVLNIDVSERATGTFQVGAGFSSIEQFILTAQIQQQNLFGNGQSLSLQLQLSGIRQLIQLQFYEPWFLNTQWGLSVDAFKTIRQFQTFNRDSTGGGITFGHPIFDRRFRVSLGYRAEMVNVSDRTGSFGNANASGFRAFPTSSLSNRFRSGFTSSLRLGLTWDSRNDRYVTRRGVYAGYTAEIADRIFGSKNVFIRQDLFTRFYWTLFSSVVLRFNANLGLITSRLGKGVPLFERYYLGGIFNIRGYGLNVLGPRVGIPSTLDPNAVIGSRGLAVGGNLQGYYQLELEFPILDSAGIRGVLFHDAGNAWNLEAGVCQGPRTPDIQTDPCGFHGLRTSVGFGFRWFSPLGPLRFEWGIPLARREGEQPIRFEFTIGNSF
jgi:outer membrane protein insertion porin family